MNAQLRPNIGTFAEQIQTLGSFLFNIREG